MQIRDIRYSIFPEFVQALESGDTKHLTVTRELEFMRFRGEAESITAPACFPGVPFAFNWVIDDTPIHTGLCDVTYDVGDVKDVYLTVTTLKD